MSTATAIKREQSLRSKDPIFIRSIKDPSEHIELSIYELKVKVSQSQAMLEPLDTNSLNLSCKEVTNDFIVTSKSLQKINLKLSKENKMLDMCREERSKLESDIKSSRQSISLIHTKNIISTDTIASTKQELDERVQQVSDISTIILERQEYLALQDMIAKKIYTAINKKKMMILNLSMNICKALNVNNKNIESLNKAIVTTIGQINVIEKRKLKVLGRKSVLEIGIDNVNKQVIKHIDTDLHQGVMQRIPKADFVEQSISEINKVNIDIKVYQNNVCQLQESLLKNEERLEVLINNLNSLQSIQQDITHALEETVDSVELYHVDNDGNTYIQGQKTLTTLTTIRKKKEKERTNEENIWVSLDQLISSESYESCQIDPRFNLGLDKKRIEIILSQIPEQIEQALPYLHNNNEMKAHELLNKYSTGRGEPFFLAMDHCSQEEKNRVACTSLPKIYKKKNNECNNMQHLGKIHVFSVSNQYHVDSLKSNEIENHMTSSSKSEDEKCAFTLSNKFNNKMQEKMDDVILDNKCRYIVFKDMEDFLKANSLLAFKKLINIFIHSPDTFEIFKTQSLPMERGEQHTHRFQVKNCVEKKLVSIKVRIVFHGVLLSDKNYAPARMSASFARINEVDLNGLSSNILWENIGFSPYSMQAINTKDQFGCIVICHHPDSIVRSGFLKINVCAESVLQYSINVTAEASHNVRDAIQEKLNTFIENKCCSSQIRFDTQIVERRISILNVLIDEVQKRRKSSESDMATVELSLDNDNDIDFDAFETHKKLKAIEREHSDCCCLIEIRTQFLEDALARIKKLNQNFKECNSFVRYSVPFVVDILSCQKQHINTKRILQEVNNSKPISENITKEILIRSKQSIFYTRNDKEWISIDRVLNPHLWTSNCFNDMKNEDRYWQCPFKKSEIMDFWRLSKNRVMTTEESYCKSLILEYYGEFEVYHESLALFGEKFQNIGNSGNYYKKIQILIRELERVINSVHDFIESSVLHLLPQTCSKRVLCLNIEQELDRLLRIEINYEESGHSLLQYGDNRDCESDNSSLDDTLEYCIDDTQVSPELNSIDLKQYDNRFNNLKDDSLLLMNNKANDLSKKAIVNLLKCGGCLACQTSPCKWQSVVDKTKLERERKRICKEILLIQKPSNGSILESSTCPEFMSGNLKLTKNDFLHELLLKDRQIDDNLKLNAVDKDLHDSYATTKVFVEVSSLHGYDTLMSQQEAITSLGFEHNRLVAKLVSTEILDGILGWMLDGWYFGESSTAGLEDVDFSINRNEISTIESQTLGMISKNACIRTTKLKFKQKNNESRQFLDITETNIKFRMFSLTFMYFHMLHVARKNLHWPSVEKNLNRKKSVDSLEKKKTIEDYKDTKQIATKYLQTRSKPHREAMRASEKMIHINKIKTLHKTENIKKKATLKIQQIYRGHLGRNAATLLKEKKEKLVTLNTLFNACSTSISRVWKGFTARKKHFKLQQEMANYILNIREEEAKQDEDEYWLNHKYLKP